MKIAIVIVMFLLIGAFFIISQENLALNSSENIGEFAQSYASWLGKIVDNTGDLTGYVLKLEWLPDQQTGE